MFLFWAIAYIKGLLDKNCSWGVTYFGYKEILSDCDIYVLGSYRFCDSIAIMRFRKGSKVEVLRKKELPTGEWRCGKIISGNGHTYSVVYEGSFGMRSEALVERVPRNAIRPCPPSVGSVESCSVGDVVEVFDVGSWKVAMVLKVSAGDYCLVRLLGSCEEFRVQKSNIRVRQSWQDNKWVVIGKVIFIYLFFLVLVCYYV